MCLFSVRRWYLRLDGEGSAAGIFFILIPHLRCPQQPRSLSVELFSWPLVALTPNGLVAEVPWHGASIIRKELDGQSILERIHHQAQTPRIPNPMTMPLTMLYTSLHLEVSGLHHIRMPKGRQPEGSEGSGAHAEMIAFLSAVGILWLEISTTIFQFLELTFAWPAQGCWRVSGSVLRLLICGWHALTSRACGVTCEPP